MSASVMTVPASMLGSVTGKTVMRSEVAPGSKMRHSEVVSRRHSGARKRVSAARRFSKSQ